MNIVKQNGSGHYKNVDKAVLYYVRDQATHTRRDEVAGAAQIDRCVIVQHVEPDPMCFCKLFSSKSGSLHFFEQSGHRTVPVYWDRPGGDGQKLRSLGFLLSYHSFSTNEISN